MKKYQSKYTHPILKETIYYKKMKCGFPVFVLRKPGFSQKFAMFAVKYGSLDIDFKLPANGKAAHKVSTPEGIAHFLEHKLFEQEYGNVSDEFAKLGASSNAFTTYTHTAYYFSTTERFYPSLDLLLQFTQTPYFTEESVNREREIIRQEINMYRDDPDSRLFANMMKTVYRKHPMRTDIVGTGKSIDRIDKSVLEMCYGAFYNPKNTALVVCGDLKPEEVYRRVEKNMIWKRAKAAAHIAPELEKEVYKRSTKDRMQTSTPKFLMTFLLPDLPREGKEVLRRNMLGNIALMMLLGKSTPLYNELYNSGLIDTSFSTEQILEKDMGLIVMGGDATKPRELREALIKGIRRAKKDGFKKSDFDRILKRDMGKVIRFYDSPEAAASSCLFAHFHGIGMFDGYDMLTKVKFEDVCRTLETDYDEKKLAWTLIEPEQHTGKKKK